MNTKKPEILFIYPCYNSGHFLHHLGTGYIIAYLRQKGIPAGQFTNFLPLKIEALSKQILDKGANIVGFTCYDANYFFVKILIKYLKKLNPDIVIIAGGPTATFSDNVILKNMPEVDLCVRGEGEHTVYELINELGPRADLGKISGITYRRGRKIIRNEDRPLLQNEQGKNAQLDIMPSPYLSGVLDPNQVLSSGEAIPIITSRGCIYKCTYCNFAAISRHKVRYHSAERVIEELKIIRKLIGNEKNIPVVFCDDCFTLNKQRVKKICDYITRENINNLEISITTRADYVNKDILESLFLSGVRYINFGLESASPKVLYNIKKVRMSYLSKNNFEPEKKFIKNFEKSVRMAKKIGFNVSASVILGLPGESLKDGLATINFVKRLGLNAYYHNYLFIFAGTELFNEIVKNKYDASELRIKQNIPVLKNRIYLYDVLKIPIPENAIHPARKPGRSLLPLASFLSGSFYGGGNENASVNLILATKKIPINTLVKNAAPESTIFLGNNIAGLLDKNKAKIGIYSLNLAQMLEAKDNLRDLYNFKVKFMHGFYIEYYEFKRFVYYRDRIRSSNGTGNIIFGILSNSDAVAFEKFLSHIKFSYFKEYMNSKNNYILLDACRWSNSCPARENKRLIIDKNYNVLPCFHGRVLGRFGNNFDEKEIKNNYSEYWKMEMQKRGCKDCAIRESCSQCPFLGDIDRLRYCDIKRRYSMLINKFIFLWRSKNAMRLV